MFDHNAYNRERYRTFRKKWIEDLGGKCVQCGSTDDLEIDHIDRTTKSFDISRENSIPKAAQELTKCQLLCKICHKKKSIAESSVEHGGGVSGKRNCKCRPCVDKKNEYMREWKRKWRARNKSNKTL